MDAATVVTGLSIAGGIITLLVFARNDGKRAAQQGEMALTLQRFEKSLTDGLSDVRAEFRRFNDHIDENALHRETQAEWRGAMNGRVERVEGRAKETESKHEELRKRVHDVAEKTGHALSGVELLKERTQHLTAKGA